MLKRKLLVLCFLISLVNGFAQSNEKLEVGCSWAANVAVPNFEVSDFGNVTNVQIKPKVGMEVNLMMLYRLNRSFGLRVICGTIFRNNPISFEENGAEKVEEISPTLLVLALQLNYYLSSNWDVILSYSPKPILNYVEDQFRNNMSAIDHSIDFGIGYVIEFEKMKMHPELRYSIGLNSIWIPGGSELGQSVSSLTVNTISLYLSFYSGKFRKKG